MYVVLHVDFHMTIVEDSNYYQPFYFLCYDTCFVAQGLRAEPVVSPSLCGQ